MSLLRGHEISALSSKNLEVWLQYCVGDVLISNIVLAVTEDPCCSAFSQHCVTLTFSKGCHPMCGSWLSLVLSTVTCIFVLWFSLLVSFQVFWPLVIYLHANFPALASKCGGLGVQHHAQHLTFLTSLLTIPSFLPSLPFLFCVCLHFDQFPLI